jgi:hypothetical protein
MSKKMGVELTPTVTTIQKDAMSIEIAPNAMPVRRS